MTLNHQLTFAALGMPREDSEVSWWCCSGSRSPSRAGSRLWG